MDETKQCTNCKEVKPVTSFYPHNRYKYRPECKSCSTILHNEYQKRIRFAAKAAKPPKAKKTIPPCSRCNKLKKKESYSRFENGELKTVCKWCEREIRKLNKKPKEKRIPMTKEEARVNSKKHMLKRRYGISIEQYDEMNKRQGGCCAVCKNPPSSRSLHVDHDHETGKVRELLCSNCNAVLGQSKESIKNLKELIKYLEKHKGAL